MKKRGAIFGVLICLIATAFAVQNSELNGYVTWQDRSPAKGVVMIIGRYSITTDEMGYYKFSFLQPGEYTVVVSPPRKPSRFFKVKVADKFTHQDYTINW